MIRIERLSKSYDIKKGRAIIFKDVNLTIPTGRSIAILGSGGSGKTTLLNLIGGIDFPTIGKIKTELDMSWPISHLRYEKSMSVRQNIRFVARLSGRENFDHIEEEVKTLSLVGDRMSARTQHFTVNELRPLDMAIALALNFDVYLFDGAINFGNQSNKEILRAAFDKKMKTSQVIMAVDNPAQAKEYCDASIVIKGNDAIYFDVFDEGVEEFKISNAVN